MAKPRQTIETTRRIPRQSRAAETVTAILEGAAQILETGGLAAFTTNAVADTMARARHYGQRAIDVLGSFAKGPARDALTETVEFAIHRAY